MAVFPSSTLPLLNSSACAPHAPEVLLSVLLMMCEVPGCSATTAASDMPHLQFPTAGAIPVQHSSPGVCCRQHQSHGQTRAPCRSWLHWSLQASIVCALGWMATSMCSTNHNQQQRRVLLFLLFPFSLHLQLWHPTGAAGGGRPDFEIRCASCALHRPRWSLSLVCLSGHGVPFIHSLLPPCPV